MVQSLVASFCCNSVWKEYLINHFNNVQHIMIQASGMKKHVRGIPKQCQNLLSKALILLV